MISKNSFLANLIENNKRRIWVWVLSLLSYVLIYPAYTAMRISKIGIAMDNYIQDYGEAKAKILYGNALLKCMHSTLGFCDLIAMMTAIIAVFSAIQGFSYLYSRKKIDFYHGLPIKRKKRFFIIWLNGILIFLIPYIIGLLVSIGIAAYNNGIDAAVLTEIVIAFGTTIIYYLGVYHLAILAVMLTGKVVITGLGFVVLCVYELLLKQAIATFQELFFHYTSYEYYDEGPLLSPFQMYFNAFSQYQREGQIRASYLIGLVLFALVLGILSYFCYKRRPAEAAGRAMAFPVTQAFVKIPIVVLFAMLTGIVISASVGFDPKNSMSGLGNVIFAMTVAVILGCGIIQVIYEADIRGALHKKRHIVICGVLTTLVFLNYKYDLQRFDAYVPNPDKVQSIAFIPECYDMAAGNTNAYFDNNGNYISEYSYCNENMYIKDVSSVCDLARLSMQKYEAAGMPLSDGWHTSTWSRASIVYRLKNGRDVSRTVMVDTSDEESKVLLDKIIGTDEFKKGYFAGASDALEKLLKDNEEYSIYATYGNTIYNKKVSSPNILGLVNAYRKDMEKVNFRMLQDNMPIGVVTISFEKKNQDYFSVRDCSFNIYPFFENCIAYMKEQGYYQDYQLNPDDIDRIQVVNHNLDIYNQKQQQAVDDFMQGKYDEQLSTRTFVNYTEAEKIAQIADCVYPSNMLVDDWDNGATADSNYEVIVFFKAESVISKEYGVDAYYSFVEGQIPEFVKEDTAYKEENVTR